MKERRSIFDVPTDPQLGVTRLVTARGRLPAVGEAGRGEPVMLLKLAGDSQVGRVCTVVVSAVKSPNLNAEGYAPGIITAIARFGNGAGVSELQFDVPCAETHDPISPGTNGLAFTVPAGNFELYARDDSLIMPQAGAGHPSSVGGSLVTAFIVRGHIGLESLLHKTEFFAWSAGGGSMGAAGVSRRFSVPPFAASYIIVRHPREPMTIRLGCNLPTVGQVLTTDGVTEGNNHAAKLVPPRCSWIEVENTGDGAIDFGQIVFNMNHNFEGEQIVAEPFLFVSIWPYNPGTYTYVSRFFGGPLAGFTGPVVLTFNADLDPSTVILGDTVLVTQPAVGRAYDWRPFFLTVVGSTIEIRKSRSFGVLTHPAFAQVECATTGPLDVTAAGAGVGKTLTLNSNGALTIDGYTPSLNGLVQVAHQTDSSRNNGIYRATTIGDPFTPAVLTRWEDFDERDEFTAIGFPWNDYHTEVLHGEVNGGTKWHITITDDSFVVDDHPIVGTVDNVGGPTNFGGFAAYIWCKFTQFPYYTEFDPDQVFRSDDNEFTITFTTGLKNMAGVNVSEAFSFTYKYDNDFS